MPRQDAFISTLEREVSQQLQSRKVGYLLGAGSSYLNGNGYPLASDLWSNIRERISDASKRDEIQAVLDDGANGIEHALDLLDDGGATDSPYRHLVTEAIAELFLEISPPLEKHIEFLKSLEARNEAKTTIFSLNYDPLIERAADIAKIRVIDGFVGSESAFFNSSVFEESIGTTRGGFRGRRMEITSLPIRLVKLHGSIGWSEDDAQISRRGPHGLALQPTQKRLMIPPQRRKAVDTMYPPYSSLWSIFRGVFGHGGAPIHRLVVIGYGFQDEHVNAVVEA